MKNNCDNQCNLNFMCEHMHMQKFPNSSIRPVYRCELGVGILRINDKLQIKRLTDGKNYELHDC